MSIISETANSPSSFLSFSVVSTLAGSTWISDPSFVLLLGYFDGNWNGSSVVSSSSQYLSTFFVLVSLLFVLLLVPMRCLPLIDS